MQGNPFQNKISANPLPANVSKTQKILKIARCAKSNEMQGYPLPNRVSADFPPENICKIPQSWNLPNLRNPVTCKGTPYKTTVQAITLLETFAKWQHLIIYKSAKSVECKSTPYKTGFQLIPVLEVFVKRPNPGKSQICKILWNTRVPPTKQDFG